MLIVAIPKSAGSSLTKTLAETHKLVLKSGITHYGKVGKSPNLVEYRHGSMRNIKKEDAEQFKKKNTIYHEHIFPTKKNIKLLKDQKKVILLRDPEEILHSWWRAEQSVIHPKLPMLKDCKTEEEYVKKAKKLGALKIFQDFKKGWEENKGKNDLIIYYKDLMDDPGGTINKIEKFFYFPESKKIKLLKEHYSRIGKLGKIAKKTYIRLQKIKPLVKLKRKLFP
jgi:hypothetical protein